MQRTASPVGGPLIRRWGGGHYLFPRHRLLLRRYDYRLMALALRWTIGAEMSGRRGRAEWQEVPRT
jgi:hypothetical protein